MKHLLFLVAFLATNALFAQGINISFTGTVTDTNGNPVPDVMVYMFTDSIPGAEYYDQLLTDANGQFSGQFMASDNNTQGALFAYLMDCNGAYILQTAFWNPGNTSLTYQFVWCDVQDDCNVWIGFDDYELSAIVFGVAPFAYSWNTGEATASISANAPGEYCVTMTDALGCSASACFYYSTVIDSSCYVYITEVQNGTWLQANASEGVAPYAYTWSTGENTAAIGVSEPGFYCVTATDATGCSASACYYWGTIIDSTCYVYIEWIQGGTSVEAIASDGAAPYSYEWSTGETTAAIFPSESGQYCVTATDSEGCSSSSCIYFWQPVDVYEIYGWVYLQDSTEDIIVEGLAYLFQLDEVTGELTAIDTVAITPIWGVGTYDFGTVVAGSYIVLAELTENSYGYGEYLPTYYNSTLWWNEATVIHIPNNTFYPYYNIQMIPGENLAGPGLISGYVLDGENLVEGQIEIRDNTPLVNATVILLDQNETQLTHAKTDENGRFEFAELPWGTYKVVLEIPGIEQAFYWITIGPEHPSDESIVFEVIDEAVVAIEEAIDQYFQVRVFPNPVSNQLNIGIKSEHLLGNWGFSLSDLSSKTLLTRDWASAGKADQQAIDLSALPAGVYLLRLQVNGQSYHQMVVKP
ncbi:MAG TPA: carboxypeptidase regulatory-like domain-containing protein [Saprospiraceae bacterium]|nr:carboxypeptidase regulatory-like domain-containing protein [Saprospiraceae bacterium]HMQ84592.1 carboxypeptidase regulatory-like domain-containing protein [Saprospiraceae bacterium]